MTPRIPRKFIVEKTAEAFGRSFDDLIGRKKDRETAFARFAAFLIIRSLRPDTSTPVMGRLFSGRDHSTILGGLHRARGLMAWDDEYRGCVERALELIADWKPKDFSISNAVSQSPPELSRQEI